MTKPEYKLEPVPDYPDRLMASGPGVERWIFDQPLTRDQRERIVQMLGAAYAIGHAQARYEIQRVLGIDPSP